jgi:hypothetical protein
MDDLLQDRQHQLETSNNLAVLGGL